MEIDMPDLELHSRVLELELCRDEGERQYVRGKQAGIDAARRQVMWIALVIALLFLSISAIIASAQPPSLPPTTSPASHESMPDAAPTHRDATAPVTNAEEPAATPATVWSALIPLTGLLASFGLIWLGITLFVRTLGKRR
jgi:hypothetical protein